jgi:hypothetical protein
MNSNSQSSKSRKQKLPGLDIIHLCVIAAVLVSMIPGNIYATGVLLGLALFSLIGPKQVVYTVSLLTVIINLNTNLVMEPPSRLGLVRWFVIACCFFTSVRCMAVKQFPAIVITQSALLGFLAILSGLFSYDSTISLMKITSFFLGSIACLGVFHCGGISRDDALRWCYNLFAVVLLASFALAFNPLGYKNIQTVLGTEQAFIGLFNRPNDIGTFISLNLGWLIPKMLIAKQRTWPDVLLACVAFSFVFMSRARGPVLVIGVTTIMFFATSLLVTSTWRGRARKVLFNRVTVVGAIALSAVIAWKHEVLLEKASAFLTKNEASLIDSIDDRLGGMQYQVENVKKYPFFGLGFGIDTFPEWWISQSGKITYDPLFKFPISASSEKGSAVVSLLEENGIIGFIAIILAWGSFLVYIIKHGDSLSMILFFAAMAVNLTEFIMCSVGGLGLYMWLMVGMSLAPVNENTRSLYLFDYRQPAIAEKSPRTSRRRQFA